jgi:YtkA-like
MRSFDYSRGGRRARLFARSCGLVCASVALFFCAACHRKEASSQVVSIDYTIAPQPPRIGEMTATFSIADSEGKPMVGAHLTVEADMSHAGMSPVFSDAKEVEWGHYQSRLILGMAGDWVILLHGFLPGGEKLERQFDLKGVRPN